MTQHDDLDRLLTAWLDDPYTPPAPRYLGRVLERTRRTRQRPAWASLERWIPMADKVLQPATTPPMRMARLLLIALLVMALATAAAIVGSRLLNPTPVIPQGGTAVFVFSSIESNGAGGDIYLARADGTDVRQLTSGPGLETTPTWSPDGTRIAYRVWEGGTDSIVVMDAGGGNSTTLSATSANASYCARGDLTWSPNGMGLIFQTSPVCDMSFDLFIAPTDGSSPATRLLTPGLEGRSSDWSPDGKQIAFLGRDATGSVGQYVVDAGQGDALEGGLQARRILDLAGLDFPNAAGASWSPDSTELALASDTGDVVVVKPDGSEPRVVAETAFNPAWSPDGRRLAFQRIVDPSEYFHGVPCTARAWVVDADGKNERRLDPLMEGCAPAPQWSPDGTRLAGVLYVATPDDPNIGVHYGVMTVDGSDPQVALQDGGAGSWQPVVAPIPAAPSFEAPASTP